jgi:signal transduction histidine kinase
VLIRGLTLRALLVGAALGVVIVGGFVALTIALQTLRSADRSDDHTQLVLATSYVLQTSVLNLETGVRGYLLSGKRQFLEPYTRALAAYPIEAERLVRLTSDDRPEQQNVIAIGSAIAEYVRDWAAPNVNAGAANPTAIRRSVALGDGKRRVDAIRTKFLALNGHEQGLADMRRQHVNRLGKLILALGILGMFLSGALVALSGLLLHRTVVVPVRRLAAAVKRFGRGELTARVPAGGVAEVGDLTRGFNAMADELEQQNAELEQFAAIASHDLREPLRKIQSFGGLLTRRFAADLPAEGAVYVERMCAAAARMETLIDGVLDLSRATRSDNRFEHVSLDAVARDVLEDLQVQIAETGARVDVGALPEIDADELQMRQLLQNLIANALKFSRQDVVPVITVRGKLERGVFELTVTDNGIGFEQRHAERIFGPFQRLHGRTEYAGTGLGLALCRRIAERHGGSIVARATPGAGASFIVTIPVEQPLAEAA